MQVENTNVGGTVGDGTTITILITTNNNNNIINYHFTVVLSCFAGEQYINTV